MTQHPSQRDAPIGLLLGALFVALIYITRLRQTLVAARQRGDMYRDIAAALDQRQSIDHQHTQGQGTATPLE